MYLDKMIEALIAKCEEYSSPEEVDECLKKVMRNLDVNIRRGGCISAYLKGLYVVLIVREMYVLGGELDARKPNK